MTDNIRKIATEIVRVIVSDRKRMIKRLSTEFEWVELEIVRGGVSSIPSAAACASGTGLQGAAGGSNVSRDPVKIE